MKCLFWMKMLDSSTPPPRILTLSPPLSSSTIKAFQAASCTDFFPRLPPPLNTKGGCPGSGGVPLLKCEGLSGATSVSLTKRGAEGNEGQVCVMVSTPPLKVTQHCWPAEV